MYVGIMIVIVDAYNVLKYSKHDIDVGYPEIATFLHDIRRRARRKKYRLIAVFDGGSSSHSTRTDHDGVEVVYAGSGRSADDIIEALCGKYRGHEVVLISADRALCHAATELGTLCVSPALYMSRVHERGDENHKQYVHASLKLHEQHDTPISPEEFRAMMEASTRAVQVKAVDEEGFALTRDRPSQRKKRSVTLRERMIEKL
jgi:predicted RNA-binding protein with PIN domain